MRDFYQVNEVFYSIQGEGMRAGTPNVFIRMSGCNLTCSADGEAGFDCDTEFVSGRARSTHDLWNDVIEAAERECVSVPHWKPGTGPWIIFTGGEPALQVDKSLIDWAHGHGCSVAIETNGTRELPEGIDWVSCSPKSAEHTLKLKRADELRYVRHAGMGIPRPSIPYTYGLISPAFRSMVDGTHEFEAGALEWSIKLVKENPNWRLSVQQHKLWKVR